MKIRSVPTWYRGTRFASTLEADWARTFDTFGWEWQYEPEALTLSSGELYRPDFYLPGQRVWCEVKGPHDERRHKATQLHRDLNCGEIDEWSWYVELVVVLRPPRMGGRHRRGSDGAGRSGHVGSGHRQRPGHRHRAVP